LIPYGIVIQTVTAKTALTLGILVIPLALLFWIERRFVLAFVEPGGLMSYRPTVKHRRPGARVATS
jgi:hypothetical protein